MLKQSNRNLESGINTQKNVKDIQDILDEYYFTVWADSLEADEEFQLLNLEYNLYHKDLINKKGG